MWDIQTRQDDLPGMRTSLKIGIAAAVVVFAGLFAMAAFGYLVVQSIKGNELAREGYAAMAAKDYDKAISTFNTALTKPIGPEQRAYVYLNRAGAWNCKGRF